MMSAGEAAVSTSCGASGVRRLVAPDAPSAGSCTGV